MVASYTINTKITQKIKFSSFIQQTLYVTQHICGCGLMYFNFFSFKYSYCEHLMLKGCIVVYYYTAVSHFSSKYTAE